MEGSVGDRYLNRLSQIRLNLIYGSISSCCSILDLPEILEHIRQEKKLASIMCDLESGCMR